MHNCHGATVYGPRFPALIPCNLIQHKSQFALPAGGRRRRTKKVCLQFECIPRDMMLIQALATILSFVKADHFRDHDQGKCILLRQYILQNFNSIIIDN